ncbi:hypothetical protein ACFL49_03640 [Candidatus Omnitrophota bacterium]
MGCGCDCGQGGCTPQRIGWEEGAQKNFEKILEEIPAMIRGVAEARVTKKAQALVSDDGRSVIEEKDMVNAFFAETPGGFLPPMKASMEELGIDYVQYGY